MRQQRERREQQAFVRWFNIQHPEILIVASANGGSRNLLEAANMKRDGVLAGMPDIQVFRASNGYHGLLIEMKAPKDGKSGPGRLSVVQKLRMQQLNDAGYLAVPAWGWLQAKEIVEEYLNDE